MDTRTYQDIEDRLGASGFRVVDDGTLDTVLQCVTCGEQLRYDVSADDGLTVEDANELTDESATWERVTAAIWFACEDHELHGSVNLPLDRE